MLKVFRDNLKKLAWILWLVIAVFILLVFVDFGRASRSQAPSNAAASVGDHEVTWAEFQRADKGLEQRFRQVYGDRFSPQLAQQLQIKRQAIEQLLNDEILLEEARHLGLQVTDKELRDKLLSIPGFTDAQGRFLSPELYQRVAQANGFPNPADLEAAVRRDMLLEKLRDVLSQTIYVADADVEQTYRDDVERAKIRYLQLPRTRFAQEAQVGQAALQGYYDAHKEELRLPEQRVIDYLLVDKAALRAQLEVSDQDLHTYYQAHQDDFTREAQVRARHILLLTGDERTEAEAKAEIETIKQRIAGGEDFAKVAREVSEDPGSAKQGGDLGYFGKGRMTPEFEKAAFGAQVGELVGPVVTPFGVHLIQVTDTRPGGAIPFEQARQSVRNRVVAERLEPAAQDLASKLRQQVADAAEGQRAATMRRLAQENKAVTFATSAPFGREDVVPGLGRSPALGEAVFALDQGKLADGTIETPRGPVIVRLAEVKAPRLPPLSEVAATVRREVERAQEQKLAKQKLAEVKKAVEEGKSLDEAAKELGVEVTESAELGRSGAIQGLGVVPEINQAALAADQGAVIGPFETAQGAVVAQVTERKGFDAAEFAQRKDQIREQLAQQQTGRLLSSLVQERRRQEGVWYSDALVEELNASNKES